MSLTIADLDALPVAIRELILTKHYWAIHAEKLQRILLDPPRTMGGAVFNPRPTADNPNRGYYHFKHALPNPSFWYASHNLPIPKTMIEARGFQVAEFRRRYFAKKLGYYKKMIHTENTPIYPHPHGGQKTDAEILKEIAERDEQRLI